MEFIKSIIAILHSIFTETELFSLVLFLLFVVPLIKSFLNMGW